MDAHTLRPIVLVFPSGNQYTLAAGQFSFDTLAKALGAGERWITVHSGGNKDGKGTPVLVRETQSGSGVYHVIGGAGGKLNYLKLKNVKSVEHYRQEAAEGRKAKTEVKKEKIKRDKELGIHESKQKARDDVKSQASAAEREYIKTVAEAMGWEGHQFDPEPTLNLSDAAQKKAFETHHKEWLKKAAEAVDLQRQRLLSDADAREEAFSGEVPLETPDNEVISTQDLDPVRPVTGAGFAADFKAEAEKRGATKDAVKAEKQAMQSEDAPKPRSAEKRQETAKQIAEELKDIRDPVPETAKVKLVEAKQAVELLKAEKKLKAIHAKAREANKQIDKAVEPKGVYNLEAGDADLDAKVKEELENDLKTAVARGFLEEVGKQAGDDPEKSLGRHLGIGANNAFNAVALTSAGAGLIDRMAVDVLGIAGAAQVLARRLQNDLTPDEFADLQDGLQTYHVDHYMAATDDAVKEAMEWRDVAKGIELEAASNGHDLTRMRELNQKRMDAVDSATRILGQTLGEMEANAALIMSMKQGKKDTLEVSLGNISLEDAITRARAIGLDRGQYQINSVGSERFLSLSGAGMDGLAKPITREDQAQIRGNLDIMEGRHDEDGWLPKGIANRPDLATHIQPGISPRLAQQFDTSGGVEQGLKDYIGGRAADGDAPADIVADLLSQDMIEKAGDKDAYLAALDKLAPMKGEDGKLIRAEAHQANFEKYADEFVSNKYGGDVAPLHRQTFETNQKSVDALHRALSEEPAGTLAYQPVGDLDSKGQRALRDWWWANVGKKDERAAGLRQELVDHEKNQPEKETVDMFGETSTNPAWQAWKQERDEKAEALNAAGLDWHKYTQIMGGPAKAHQAVQDMIRGRVAQHFHQAYNTLNPGAPIKLGRTVIAGNLNHLDAVDPAAREQRINEQRQLVDPLRERVGGKYASGAVSDKINAAREQKEAAEPSQMGFFSMEPEPEQETPLAADQRHTLGHAAEQKITAMMSQVGQNFKPGEPTNLWQASMSGKYVNQQRAVKLLEKNKRVVLPQGVGCVDGGTILDDAECRGWSFDQWLQSGEQPVVFSKVGEQISLVQASPIFTKGTDEMFLVKTENGREITVTGLHRFLTPDGWQQLRDIGVGAPIFCTASPAPGEYAQDLLQSKAEHVQSIRVSSAPSSQQTVQDYPENCCRERRPYGEQPRLEEEGGQEFAPSQGDALGHNRSSLHSDGLACEQEHTHPCQYEYRHSKTDSLLHAARLGFAWMTRSFSSTTEQILQKTQAFAQFLACSCFHRGTCDERRMHQAQQEISCESRALAFQTSVAHAKPLTYQSQIETQPSLCLHCSRPQTQQSPNKGSSAFLPSRIASVVSVGYRLVYDLSVPLSENYIAHGIVNHNSGKTVMMLGGFSHLHETGKAKRGLFVVPSIVQGQFSGEALRYLDPNANGGKGFKWHIEPGASREDRIKAYQDPDTHFSVVTHQGFRDDMVHLGAKQAGIDESAMAEKINGMDTGARKEWMRGVMDKAGMSHDFLAVDEGHDLLNRAGKENSLLANVVDSVAHNTPYYVNASADPVKNDPSELFSLLQKVDPERYNDPKAFMRKYGVDTPSAKDELRRELARYFYPGKIESGVKVTRKVEDVKLTTDQHKEAKAVESNLARARLARMRGEVDIEAVKALSPSSFEGVDAARHGEIAKKLQTNLGILKESAYRKAINGHENGAKQDAISRLAHERRGKPGVVFAHGLAEVGQIAERLRKEGHRVVVITGSDSSKEKAKKKLMFNPEKGEAQADILVASDAGAVGLNAQRGQWLAQYDTPMTAKAQPLDAKILTPTGWVLMGDIKVGDMVIAGDGTPTAVTGVFPQGEKDIYRVKFSDGAQAECCEEHLWLTSNRHERKLKRGGSVRALSSIMKTLLHTEGARTRMNHSIPVMGVAELQGTNLPIDPYMLGVLLGNANFGSSTIQLTSADEEIIEHVRKACERIGCALSQHAYNQFNVVGTELVHTYPAQRPNRALDAVREMGLSGGLSFEKFVPQQYLWSDAGSRLAILQGLLDTDGTVDKRTGAVCFSTTAPGLVDGVIFLARSLGGIATAGNARNERYTHNGESRRGRDSWKVSVSLPAGVDYFRLSRKSVHAHTKAGRPPVRSIREVAPVGKKQAQCIMVEHESHLYVTDDFVVTHNTKHQRDGRINRIGQKNDVELIDLVADHPSERRARERLLKKDELRGILTTPLEGMDDTGLAAHIGRARMEREQKGLF